MTLDELDHAIDLHCVTQRCKREALVGGHGLHRRTFSRLAHGRSPLAYASRLFALLREVAPAEPVRIDLGEGVSLVPTAEAERRDAEQHEREHHARAVAAHHTARLRGTRPEGD